MNSLLRSTVLLLVLVLFFGAPSAASGGGTYGKISIQGLKTALGNPDLIIIDVRDANSWSHSKLKIPGANRENADDVESWAKKYPRDKKIVLY